MRPLEVTLILIGLVPALGWGLWGRPAPPGVRPAVLAAGLVLAAHAALEGVRWQMVPAYVALLGLAAMALRPAPGWVAVPASLVSLGGLTAAAVLGYLIPVFAFPTPTGPDPVGTEVRHLVDPARRETAAPGGGPRELMVQLWYPAARAGRRLAYRRRDELNPRKSHFTLVRPHAGAGVPVSPRASRYPVLIFSPSWVGGKDQNTSQAEDLASHGYVVVGLDHPYGTDVTRFPDGRVALSRLGGWLDFASDASLAASSRATEAELAVRVADVRFVLDELTRLNERDPTGLLTGRLDLGRVGTFGHSFGGAVAAEACRADPRVRAAVDYDGSLFGEAARLGVPKPFLFLADDTPLPTAADLAGSTGVRHRRLAVLDRDARNVRAALPGRDGYWLSVEGAAHSNFSDMPLYIRLRRLTGAGPIPAERAIAIARRYTLALFQKALRGRDDPVLAGPSREFPEVRYEAWPGPAPPGGPAGTTAGGTHPLPPAARTDS